MNSVWQQFTLSNLPLRDFLSTSYLHRSVVGKLRSWRQTSLLIQWADVFAATLISLVYALAPFVPNELIGILLVACAALWLLFTISDETGLQATPIHLPVLLYWGVATVATALSPDKKAAVVGWQKFTLYLLMFALLARVLKSQRIRTWIITVYLHVALIVSVYGVRQKFFGVKARATWVDQTSNLKDMTRVYSYLDNPNLLAGYLIPAVVLSLIALLVWQGWMKKSLAVTMVVVNSACLYFTGSRGGWIGAAAAILMLIVLLRYWFKEHLPAFWRKWLLAIVFGSLTMLMLLGMAVSEVLRERLLSIFAGANDSSNAFRMNVWRGVVDMIRHYPVFGIGPGNKVFNKIYPLFQINPRFTALSAYSILLEVIVETGFIGLVTIAWLLVVTFQTGWQNLRRVKALGSRDGLWLMGAIATLLGMLAHGIVDTVWYRPEINTLWWLMVAIIASYWTPQQPQSRQLAIAE